MKLQIEIDVGREAFGDTEQDTVRELAVVLAEYVKNLKDSLYIDVPIERHLRDSSGSIVGYAKFVE
jgi:hypothetical protein